MGVGNVFGHVCLSVCSDYNFWTASHRNFILAWRYILTISRSSLSIKVIGSRSRSCAKNDYSLISTCYSLLCLQTINKVNVIHQGQGHTSRRRSNQGQDQIEILLHGWFAFESNAFLFFIIWWFNFEFFKLLIYKSTHRGLLLLSTKTIALATGWVVSQCPENLWSDLLELKALLLQTFPFANCCESNVIDLVVNRIQQI